MGFADRQYARQPPPPSGFVPTMRMWLITTWLIAINVAVFVLDQISDRTLSEWGYFSAATAIYHLQIWRFITFQFLHAGLGHLFFNMLGLYFFGPMIEGYLGSRRYLAFYLLCGVAGAAVYLVLWVMGILYQGANTALIGASAGIFGVLIAAARVAPDTTVMLMFPPIPMKLKVLAWILIGIAVYQILNAGPNAGGEAAHLGGAALGALLIWRPELLNVFENFPPRRRKRRFYMDGR
jgi:membrane associated rhomboid family serine protease